MKRALAAIAIAAALLIEGAGGAMPEQSWGRAAMTTGAPMPPPGGFVLYCLNFPGECAAGPQTPELIDLSGDAEEALDAVQASVNDAVRPRPNPEHLWLYPMNGYGDCNSYALEKKRELVARGLPRSALLLTAAYTEEDEGHLVLVARTTRGDLVLDNRVRQVVDWTRLPYRWVERQSDTNPAMWVAIEPRGVPVASASPGGSVLPSAYEACSGPSVE